MKHFKEASRIEWPRLPDYDAHVWSPSASEASLAQLIAHSYQNPVKWPRDHAVVARLHHIIHAVECKEWPASTTFSAATPERTPDLLEAHSKKLPNIAIDVETERAKLHALLNCAAAAAAATDESLSEVKFSNFFERFKNGQKFRENPENFGEIARKFTGKQNGEN